MRHIFQLSMVAPPSYIQLGLDDFCSKVTSLGSVFDIPIDLSVPCHRSAREGDHGYQLACARSELYGHHVHRRVGEGLGYTGQG
jgi:hypothetical protein